MKNRYGSKGPYIQDITKRFPTRESFTERLNEYMSTVIGVDMGEVVTASFCALDPKTPEKVSNLLVKRSALYSPVKSYFEDLQAKEQEQQNYGESIQGLQHSIRSFDVESKDEHVRHLGEFFSAITQLRDFYGSTSFKRVTFERKKSYRSEFEWAARGALSMTSTENSNMFVIGDAKFNTRKGLPSLHTSFGGFFASKVSKRLQGLRGYSVTHTSVRDVKKPYCNCRLLRWGTSLLGRTNSLRAPCALPVYKQASVVESQSQQAGLAYAWNKSVSGGSTATAWAPITWP